MRARATVAIFLGLATLAPTCLSYKSDVERTCDAEHLSGARVDTPALLDWLRRSVGTPDGVVLVNELSTKGARDRSLQLLGEARKLGIAACPLADSYEALARDEDYKQDMANLCDGRAVLPGGGTAVLDIGALPDDAERAREIGEWAAAQLKTKGAQALVDRVLREAPKARGQVLRTQASGFTTSCALADALDRPLPPPPRPAAAAAAVLPTLAISSYDSDRMGKRYSGAAIEAVRFGGAAINTCYASGLGRDPRLAGKISVKVAVDATGKMTSATADAPAFPDKKVVRCILTDAFPGMTFPKPDKGGVKFAIGLTLAPTTSLSAPAVTLAPFAPKR